MLEQMKLSLTGSVSEEVSCKYNEYHLIGENTFILC